VLSPLLGNVYLHYVLDRWFEDDVKPRLGGKALLVRYADDCARRKPLFLRAARSPPRESLDSPE
jgi:hypothetical protein